MKYSPAQLSITAKSFSHDASVFTSSHLESISLQHFLPSTAKFVSIMAKVLSDKPNRFPISLQTEAYCGVTCHWRSLLVGLDVTVSKYKYKSIYNKLN